MLLPGAFFAQPLIATALLIAGCSGVTSQPTPSVASPTSTASHPPLMGEGDPIPSASDAIQSQPAVNMAVVTIGETTYNMTIQTCSRRGNPATLAAKDANNNMLAIEWGVPSTAIEFWPNDGRILGAGEIYWDPVSQANWHGTIMNMLTSETFPATILLGC